MRLTFLVPWRWRSIRSISLSCQPGATAPPGFGEEPEPFPEVGRVREDGVGGARFFDLGEKKDEVNDFFSFGSAIASW